MNKSRIAILFSLAVPLAVVLTIYGYYYGLATVRAKARPLPVAAAGGEPGVLVVLPFETNGDDGGDRVLADGMAVVLVEWLARSPLLAARFLVIEASTCRRERLREPGWIERRYGPSQVVRTRLQRQGNSLTFDIFLLDGGGEALRATSFAVRSDRLFVAQRQIFEAVHEMLQIQQTHSRAAQKAGRPANAAAYEAYLRGRGFLAETGHSSDDSAAVAAAGFFEQALGLDLDFAPALTGLARAYLRQWRVGRVAGTGSRAARGMTLLEKAGALTLRARELDPKLDSAWLGSGLVAAATGEMAVAEAELRQSLALNPRGLEARECLGQLLLDSGSFAQAAVILDEPKGIDPYRASLWAQLGDARRWGGLDGAEWAYTQALDQLDQARAECDSEPDRPFERALYLAKAGRHEEAQAVLTGLAPPADIESRLDAAVVHLLAGREEAAREQLAGIPADRLADVLLGRHDLARLETERGDGRPE